MKNILIAVVVIALLGVGAYFLFGRGSSSTVTPGTETPTTTETPATTTSSTDSNVSVLGKSAGGRDIMAYSFGTGATNLLFVGGIHGGYSWNTVSVANQLMDYLTAHPDAVPASVRVTVVPVLNPDGLAKVVSADARGHFDASAVTATLAASVPGRFNGNTVDLNRNFDCQWKATGTWQSKSVSGGSAAFSEPESAALRDYISKTNPAGVVVWFSSAGGVYASNCGSGIPAATKTLMKTYATASGYPAHDSFDSYETSGDLTNWLAKSNIPAISVLLTNHTDAEWDKNWKGIAAVFAQYAK